MLQYQPMPERIRTHLLIYGLYLLIAVVLTWPLVTLFSTHLAGFPFGDAQEMTRHIWWIQHALRTGQPVIFQPLMAYPQGLEGVILWSNPLQFFPGWLFAFVLPLPAAYNLFMLLTLALNGWAAWWLVRGLTEHDGAAFIAGLVFMSAPTIQAHLAGGHGGLVVQWPLPLLAWAVLQLDADGTGWRIHLRRILLAAGLVILTSWGHTLQMIYAVMPLVAVIGVAWLIRRQWWSVLRLGIAVGLGGLLLIVFLLPVLSATFGTSAYIAEGGGIAFSADLLSPFTPSFRHPLYGQLSLTRQVLGINIVEGHSYIGIISLLLLLIAAWRKPARVWLALLLVAFVLSLGPLLKLFDQPVTLTINGYQTPLVLPWALVYDLPGFSLARTPGRFNFGMALAVAVLAGYGVKWLAERWQWKATPARGAVALLGLLIVLDVRAFWDFPLYDGRIPDAVTAIGAQGDVRAVFDVPWDNLLAAKDALWLQTAHQLPMIAGQVTRRTPVDPARLNVLQSTLDPALLNGSQVDVVIVHKTYAQDVLLNQARVQLGAPVYEDDRLALFTVPDTTATHDQVAITAEANLLPEAPRSSLYLYVPEPGWITLTTDPSLAAWDRGLNLRLNDRVIARYPAGSPPMDPRWTLPFPAAGYYTISVEAVPSCPVLLNPAWVCDALPIWSPAPDVTVEPGSFTPIDFASGIHLNGSQVRLNPDELIVRLWWQFEAAVNDQTIRFIKVLDASGNQIVGSDLPLGNIAADDQRLDTVTFALPDDLPPGDYQVAVGWYTFADLVRIPVLSAVEGAADGLAIIERVTVLP
jgi:hypothetical protein